MNPHIPRDKAFVDGYDFEAYEAAGFKSIQDNDASTMSQAKLTNPGLSGGDWWKYLTNVAKLSPIPKDMKFGDIPQGVLRLGGTFVISGNDVLYAWSDTVPGDHPDVGDVIAVAKKATA